MPNRRRKVAKTPVTGFTTTGRKTPVEEQFTPDARISYRFGMCDHEGDWAWSWEAHVKHQDKLADFENKTWPRITCDGSVGAKRIPTAHLPTPAIKRLRKIERDDTDALWELRMGNKPRFWGQRHGSAMCFLWWDEHHTVFPRTNKHKGGN